MRVFTTVACLVASASAFCTPNPLRSKTNAGSQMGTAARQGLDVKNPRLSVHDMPVDIETAFAIFDPLNLALDEEAQRGDVRRLGRADLGENLTDLHGAGRERKVGAAQRPAEEREVGLRPAHEAGERAQEQIGLVVAAALAPLPEHEERDAGDEDDGGVLEPDDERAL